MSVLKKKLSLIFSNDIEKALINVIDTSSDSFLDEENFDSNFFMKFQTWLELVNFLENKNPKFNQRESFVAFLKHCHKQTSWPGALKALMTFHKLIHVVGEELCQMYHEKQTQLCLGFKGARNNQKNILHSSMIPLYSNYLQKLSYNYEDLKICFYPNGKFHEYIKMNNLTMLHFLSKVQNILNYLLNITSLFETSFKEFANVKLIKQFAYFCMTDCGYYYDFVNGIVIQMLEEIFGLSKEDAVFLYEIYTEHVKITRKTVKLFELRSYLPEFELKVPSFFVVNPGLSKQIQLYINQVKLQLGPAKIFLPKFKRPGLALNMDVVTEGDSPTKVEPEKQEHERVLKTVDDLSKSMIQITTPCFKEAQKKELFKAPSKDAIQSTNTNTNEDEKENRDFANARTSARGSSTFGSTGSPVKKIGTLKRANSVLDQRENVHLDSFRPVNVAH